MRRWISLAVALSFALAGLSFGAAEAAPKTKKPQPDWVMLSGRVPSDTTIRGHGRLTGAGPLVVGYGVATEGYSTVYVSRIGGDGLSVRLGALGLDVRLVPGEDRFTIEENIYAGEGVTAALLFVANARFSHLDTSSPETLGYGPGTKVTTGTGSRAISLTSGDSPGVVAGPAGAASTLVRMRSKHGLVGGYDWNCVACSGQWRAPGGRGDGFSAAQLYGNFVFLFAIGAGGSSFSGPPGAWSLRWTGATDNDPYNTVRYGPRHTLASPIFAAYAPIGRAWRYFKDLDAPDLAETSDFMVPGSSDAICVGEGAYRTISRPAWDAGAGVPRRLGRC